MKLTLALVITAILILGLSLSGSFITGFIIRSVTICEGISEDFQRAICDGNTLVIQKCKKDIWMETLRKECVNEKCNEINSFTAVCGELCKHSCKDKNTIDSADYEKGICIHNEIICPSGFTCLKGTCVK